MPSGIAELIVPGRSFVLGGPSRRGDAGHWPVRGDLAHIRLAGKVFVPHYVVPLAHTVNGSGAQVLNAGRGDGEPIARLPTGTVFNVLDISGTGDQAWAWGQAGEDGPVGYVPLAALHPAG